MRIMLTQLITSTGRLLEIKDQTIVDARKASGCVVVGYIGTSNEEKKKINDKV